VITDHPAGGRFNLARRRWSAQVFRAMAAWPQLKIALATEFTSVIMLAGAVYRCEHWMGAPAVGAQTANNGARGRAYALFLTA